MPQPFTIKHGSWAPDLQNVAVQIPYQYTATEVPSSNVSGVYYQDGAFRCLPAPNPFAYALGVMLSTTFTAGTSGSYVGYGSGAFGGIANPIDANGNEIAAFYTLSGTLILIIDGPELGPDYFDTITFGTGSAPPALNNI